MLVASIAPQHVDELKTRAERAFQGGADAVEVRIDAFLDDPALVAPCLRSRPDKTWIVTCRGKDEGGLAEGNPMERAEKILPAVTDTNAYVDFEYAGWRNLGDARSVLAGATATAEGSGPRLILSAHHLQGRTENPAACIAEMAQADPACVPKYAYRATHACDSFDALDLMHDRGPRVTAIAMGEGGLWTRVLAKKLGAFASYCALESQSATALGQPTLREMVELYRWPNMNASTRVFGVIGDPVAHSVSPLVFNRWFADARVNAMYVPLRVGGAGDELSRFLGECRQRPWLDIGGFSVTTPHKTAARDWVGDGADPMADWIGALNTITFDGQRVTGYNTDSYAAVSSLVAALGCERCDLSGVSVDVLGVGGSARAVMHGLFELGCSMTVHGRSEDKTRALAEEYSARAASWEDRTRRRGEIVINCTGVGMWPELDASPLPAEALTGCRLVFDLIYNPLETRLLKDAARAGATALNGLDMFVRQAAAQFELWTRHSPDTETARELIRAELERTAQALP